MNMKKFTFLMATTLVLAGMSLTANAQTDTMGFISAQGNNSGNVDVYPYNFTISGSAVSYPLMCDSFNNRISNGENWTATTLNVANLNAGNATGLEVPSAGVAGYLEASYLFVEEVTAYTDGNSDPEGLYNWAVWDLFTGTDPSGSRLSSSDETTVQGYLSAAVALGSENQLTLAQFSNVVIYTPTDTSGGGPQEFFGYFTPVPEPSTTGLVVVGLLGALTIRRRK
jgi:hypothetical protein